MSTDLNECHQFKWIKNHFKRMIHWQFITCIQFPKRVWTDEVFWKIGWKKERSVQAQTLIHTHAHTCPVTPHPHPHNQNTYTLHQKHQHLIHSQANILTAHQHPAKWHMHTERCSIHTWLPSLMNKWNDPIRVGRWARVGESDPPN